jgi:hypothetical protein
LINLQNVVGDAANALRNCPAVHRLERNRFENEKVESALNEVGGLGHGGFPLVTDRDYAGTPVNKQGEGQAEATVEKVCIQLHSASCASRKAWRGGFLKGRLAVDTVKANLVSDSGHFMLRHFPTLATLFAFFASLSSTAATPAKQAESDRFELRGTVINATTGEPVSRAMVQLNAPGGVAQLSGADGTFIFTNLPRGQYVATALKPGFFNEEELGRGYASKNTIANVPSSQDLLLKLTPEGVIYGEVKNEDGEPIEGIRVKVTRLRVAEGQKIIEPQGEILADDEGAYRIADLRPGHYRVSFAQANRGVIRYVRDFNRKQEAEQGYASEFYPGVADAESAAVIEVKAGAQIQVTQILKRQRLFEISGVVHGGDPEGTFNLMLRDTSGDYVPENMKIDQKRGQFQIVGVPEGTYTLLARGQRRRGPPPEEIQPALSATQQIHLTSDVIGMVLALQSANSVEIQVRDEIPPDGSNVLHQAVVRFVSLENSQFSPALLVPNPVGERVWTERLDDIPPGTYRVEAMPNQGSYVASLRCGRTDLLREDLTVDSGAALPPIEVALRNDGAQLNVSVTDENQRRFASVVIYSDEYPRRSFLVQLDDTGSASQTNLAPGTYSLIAVDDANDLEFHNPIVMQKYLGDATEVTLHSGDKTSVRVKLQAVQGQQP